MHLPTALRIALLSILTFSSASALAQTSMRADSSALACLSTVDGVATPLAYPDIELAHRASGTLRVRLEFAGPAAAPTVAIVSRPKSGDFDELVTRHVARFRVPCMQPGESPVVLTQDYEFSGDERHRVVASAPQDEADARHDAQLACMMHVDGKQRPAYTNEAMRLSQEGTMILKLRFSNPNQPPTVEFLKAFRSPSLRRALLDHLDGMRVPCLQDAPLTTLVSYRFILREKMPALVDQGLVDLLGAARALKTPAQFDFNSMQCPFELSINYRQPYAKNQVEQLDTAVGAREPFMAWLQTLSLNLSESDNADVFGQQFTVAVPCMKIDL